ncbi:MAG: DUF6063 family protein [Bacillota bacterium]
MEQEEFTEDDFRWAFKIFMYLIKEGEITKDESDYYYAYQKKGVQYYLDEIIEEEADCKIFHLDERILLTPGISNWFLGYSNQELRSKMSLRTNKELYLGYFIILCLLAKFYNSDEQAMSSRQFLLVKELEEMVTTQVERIQSLSENDLKQREQELEISLSTVADVWQDLPKFDDELKNIRRGKKNRVSFILRVLAFLEDEELLKVFENKEIRLMPKFEYLIIKYYFNSQRKEKLLDLLSSDNVLGEGLYATNQEG